MNYIEFVETILPEASELLDKEHAEDKIFKYALKGGIIGQYAETFIINGKEDKFWQTDFHIPTNKDKWHVLLASESAIDAIEKQLSDDISLKNYKDKIKGTPKALQYPYYEHIEPKNKTYDKYLKSIKKKIPVEETLKYCKIIMITKEESRYLDGKENGIFTDEDKNTINEWRNIIGEDNANAAIDSMIISQGKNKGKYKSSSTEGTAYARIAHLFNNDVRFVWRKDPTSRAGKSQAEIIHDYLENMNREYS